MSQAGTVLELIQARRRDDALELVRSAARDAGLAAAVKLLAEVQQAVGDLWQQNELTVADEHAATAVVDLALAAACLEAERRPHALGGTVVVACAEEEWHVMPARMFAEQLTAAGWDVVFLGAQHPLSTCSGSWPPNRRRPWRCPAPCRYIFMAPAGQ